MRLRIKEEIAAEVAALRALKPVGLFAPKTRATIQIQIDALEGNIDETSDEFTVELSDEQQMAAMDAINWRAGTGNEPPSKDWGSLVEQ